MFDMDSPDHKRAWEMIYKIIQTYINDSATLYFGSSPTYKKAMKLDMKKLEYDVYCDQIAEFYIEKWFYTAWTGKSPFKTYNKYKQFEASKFLSFFKYPSWNVAQIIAGTAIFCSNQESKDSFNETDQTNDNHTYEYKVAKQWFYNGSLFVKTQDGVKIETNSKSRVGEDITGSLVDSILILSG